MGGRPWSTETTVSNFTIPAPNFEPAYMTLHRRGELRRRAEMALERLSQCLVCPRNCGVDRIANKTAACHTGRYARVGSYFPHFGEEDAAPFVRVLVRSSLRSLLGRLEPTPLFNHLGLFTALVYSCGRLHRKVL